MKLDEENKKDGEDEEDEVDEEEDKEDQGNEEDEADEDEEDDDAVVNKSRWCRCDKPPIPEHLYGEDEEEPPTRAHGAPAPLPAEYV